MRKQTYNIESRINNSLFKLSVLVTIVAIGMMLTGFFSRGAFPAARIGAFYIGVLFIYSIHKEALRWIGGKDIQKGDRRGEYFLYLWIIIVTTLYLINFLTKNYFIFDQHGNQLPALSEITFIALEVCGVFIFARVAKAVFSVIYFRSNKQ